MSSSSKLKTTFFEVELKLERGRTIRRDRFDARQLGVTDSSLGLDVRVMMILGLGSQRRVGHAEASHVESVTPNSRVLS